MWFFITSVHKLISIFKFLGTFKGICGKKLFVSFLFFALRIRDRSELPIYSLNKILLADRKSVCIDDYSIGARGAFVVDPQRSIDFGLLHNRPSDLPVHLHCPGDWSVFNTRWLRTKLCTTNEVCWISQNSFYHQIVKMIFVQLRLIHRSKSLKELGNVTQIAKGRMLRRDDQDTGVLTKRTSKIGPFYWHPKVTSV